jgi:hypothetical protein
MSNPFVYEAFCKQQIIAAVPIRLALKRLGEAQSSELRA